MKFCSPAVLALAPLTMTVVCALAQPPQSAPNSIDRGRSTAQENSSRRIERNRTWDEGGSTPTLKPWKTTPYITIRAHNASLDAIATSRDSNWIATGSSFRDARWGTQGEIKLWNAAGVAQKTLRGHTSGVKALAFSPDARTLISGAFDKSLVSWNVKTGAATKIPNRHTAPVIFLSYAPDGKTFLSGDESGRIITWNASTLRAQSEREVGAGLEKVRAYAYSWGDGLLAVGSTDQKVLLWQAGHADATLLAKKRGTVLSLAFAPGGRYLASANYTEVWLWDTESATDVMGLVHSSPVGVLAFSPDGSTLACGQHDGRIVLDPINRPSRDPVVLPYDSKITALAFTPDGSTLASGTTFGSLMLWK